MNNLKILFLLLFLMNISLHTNGETPSKCDDRPSLCGDESELKELRSYAVTQRREQIRLMMEESKLQFEEKKFFLNKKIEDVKIRHDTFRNQQKFHSKIFYLVLFLVLSSVFFVGYQLFYWARSIANASNTNRTEVQNNLEISNNTFKITTPFVGLLTLIITYLFFYMYITQVYKITSID
ncbi:MAG: hypothetical protein BGO19_12465 [Acinetobacter sp. 38-8]|nr:MAG: hypothetical protein BGO19_12465 [Acinetobacter sp. 38-8]